MLDAVHGDRLSQPSTVSRGGQFKRHPPPHVHAFGKGCEARFKLNGPDGPVELWDHVGDWALALLNELGAEIAGALEGCCKVWSEIHG